MSNNMTSFTKGIFKENPLLKLLAGICPAVAITTTAVNGIAMGIAVTAALLFSNIFASLLRNVIPERLKLPSYLVIIAVLVSAEQLFFGRFFPDLEKELGIFLPLVAVNCIILGRAKSFAEKNTVLISALDGLGMGIGFTAVLFVISAVREILGNGSILSGIDTTLGAYINLGTFKGFDFSYEFATIGVYPMAVFLLPAGGLFVFGMLLAAVNVLSEKINRSADDGFADNDTTEAADENAVIEAEEISKVIVSEVSEEFTKENEDTEESALTEENVVEEKAITEEVNDTAEPETISEINATAEVKEISEANEAVITEEITPVNDDTAQQNIIAVSVVENDNTASEKAEKVVEIKKSSFTDKTIKKESTYTERPSQQKIQNQPSKSFSKAKGRKNKSRTPVQPDLLQPLPDVIPDFVKRDIDKRKGGKQE